MYFLVSLNRKDINITGIEVDKLTYNYEANSNKLISVADAGTAASYPNVGGNFTYDNNGNQTNYLPRGITNITYNILNLVNTVSIDGKGTQNYTYAADGTKLGFKQGNDVKVKSYIGAVEYDGDGKISRIGTEEGYILKRTGWNENSKDSKFVYYYSVKDHLGNVRLVLDDESNAKLWQRNDYQAFGMHINQPVDGVPTTELVGINDRYYNGKEFDDQTTWLDYGARQYDYSLGRWMAVDPLADKRSYLTTYNFVQNNPLNRIDPDGNTDFKLDEKTGKFSQVGDNNSNPDRILKTDRNGNIKKKGEGFLGFLVRESKRGEAKVSVDNIEQGILKDGLNLKTNDNTIAVGGTGQASIAGFESFALKLSNFLNKEIGGYYLENKSDGKISNVYINKYVQNTDQKAIGGFTLRSLNNSLYNSTNVHTSFHTHLSRFGDASRLSPSKADEDSKASGIESNIKKFIIITNPQNVEY